MSYTHLTTTERVKIETYLELGMSIRSIARRLGRHPSTVSREVKRNPGYESGRAQQRYVKKKANCGTKTKLDEAGAIQCRIVDRQAPERGACMQDIRSLGARHRDFRTWEVKGMRRDVRRAEEPVLHRPSDDGP